MCAGYNWLSGADNWLSPEMNQLSLADNQLSRRHYWLCPKNNQLSLAHNELSPAHYQLSPELNRNHSEMDWSPRAIAARSGQHFLKALRFCGFAVDSLWCQRSGILAISGVNLRPLEDEREPARCFLFIFHLW